MPSNQAGFFDKKLHRPKLLAAYQTEEQYQADTKDLRKRRAAAAKPINEQIADIAEDLERDDALVTIESEQEKIIAKEELKAGDRVQIGEYVFDVENYDTMESVNSGTAQRAKKFTRVIQDQDEDSSSSS